MDKIIFHKFINWLLLRFEIVAPRTQKNRILYGKIKKVEEIAGGAKPENTLRAFFLPCQEELYSFQNSFQEKNNSQKPNRVFFAVPPCDLKALTRINIIFGHDKNFQEKIRETIICGMSPLPDETGAFKSVEKKLLSHLQFDLYFDQNSDQTYNIYSGSTTGEKILESFGQKDYQHIPFTGPDKEETAQNKKLRQKIISSRNSKIWQDLAKTCLACGKCSLVCPMCYCYGLQFNNDKKTSRTWSNCFYPEFSEVAGGHKFLKNRKERFYNWYDHKFVRLPQEHGFTGCVECGRCIETCPVKINIFENIEKIINKKNV